jgi:MscS family membrane protein
MIASPNTIPVGRVRALLVLAAAASVLALLWSPAPAFEEDRSSPRATFDTFLTGMNEIAAGNEEPWPEVLACLDLSGYPATVRSELGRKLAIELKTYLDKTELIDLQTIPVDLDREVYVWRRSRAGEVSLSRQPDGSWRFSETTLESLDSLVRSVRGQQFVEGVTEPPAPNTFAAWVRERLPEKLTEAGLWLENWQWIALGLVALLGVIAERLVRFVLAVWIRRLLGKRSDKLDPSLALKFERPAGIAGMGFVWLMLVPPLDVPTAALGVLLVAIRVVIVAGGIWAGYRLIDLVAGYLASLAAETESRFDDLLVPMVRRAAKIVLVAFGLVFVAQNLNVNVTSLLTGLGLGGLAVALAAKDTLENVFGSVTVLTDRPFQIGDWVKLDESIEGTVVDVGFRSTRIRTFYDSLITVPNSRLIAASVDNLGVRKYRRIMTELGIEYGTPPDKIEAFCEGIRELVRTHPYTRKDYYNVYLTGFGDFSLKILVYLFVATPDWTTELREKHRFYVDIIRLAERIGVRFAFPTQTLHLASVPDGALGVRAQPPAKETLDDADVAQLGRGVARDVLAGWGDRQQPPVDFDDPDRIRPGRG